MQGERQEIIIVHGGSSNRQGRLDMPIDWHHIRTHRYSPMTPPPDWPSAVRPLSIEGVSLLGIDPATNKLYWDGKQIAVRDRVRLGLWELILVILIAVGTFGSFIVELGNALVPSVE